MQHLVIVESPAKAKTISRFLGKEYTVLSSMGHIRDLPKRKADLPKAQQALPYASLAIDVEHDFKPLYIIAPEKKKIVSELRRQVKDADVLWIATDEDREGEAIGWHLLHVLQVEKFPKLEIHRIVFHEITQTAIEAAIANPRELDIDMVNAQQARRLLDRLVGYGLSPLLWSKIRFGLSAGRVQSVAVRLVVEREREIQAFQSDEYWSIDAICDKDGQEFIASLARIGDEAINITSKEQAQQILDQIKGKELEVKNIEKKKVRRTPAPPFTTSTLQQEASRKLGFGVKKTMMVAQKLYQDGIITYMRTDSVNLSQLALDKSRELIQQSYGKEYLPDQPRIYKTKSKNAQEAHEAIRPTDFVRRADSLKNVDQQKLYDLIWRRTMACQMKEAELSRVGADLVYEDLTFRATGQTIKFAGFMKVYIAGSDSEDHESKVGEKFLPVLSEGESYLPKNILPEQHFTKPPARYTEASLVKKMEAKGIGRPSTYAPTISTIIARGYIAKVEKALHPTDTAFVVNDLLVNHFPDVVDYKFTAQVEEELDEIAEGERAWIPMLENFYTPFHNLIKIKMKEIDKSDIVNLEETKEICDLCGSRMVVKLSRHGKFLSCSAYPECKNAKPLMTEDEKTELAKLKEDHQDEKCDDCGTTMEVKKGRYGYFLGCSKYPDCKGIKKLKADREREQALAEQYKDEKCEKCGEKMTIKRGKWGNFLGCSNYPTCKGIKKLPKNND